MAQGKGSNNGGNNGPGGKGKGGRPTPNKEHPGMNGKRSRSKTLGKNLLGKTPKALRGTPEKKLQKQAQKLMKKVYAPALHDVRTQIKSTKEIDEKREADNRYYLDWLNQQNEKMLAEANAADAELRSRQNEIQQQHADSMESIRNELLQGMNAHADTVSAAENAKALDTTPETDLMLSQVASERMRSEDQIGSNQQARQTESAANFGEVYANEAKRKADTFARLSELGDAKTKVKLERAAASAQEVTRRLDQEIEKATAKVNMKNMAAQLAVSLKEHRLNARKFKFQKRLDVKTANETERSNRADERTDKYNAHTTRMNAKEEKRHNKALEDISRDQNAIDKYNAHHDGGNDNKQDRRKATRLVKSVVNNGIVAIKTDPKLKKMAKKDPNQAVTQLRKQGADAIYAKASVELATKGSLSQSTRRALEQMGIQIPPQWLK